MKQTLSIYKPIGVTPLEIIHLVQKHFPEFADVKIAYAGRLDPMAEGLLLLLIGEECKQRKEYEKLTKEYEFEVLFGFATDSYDLMGMVTSTENQQMTFKTEMISSFVGKHLQEYPPYSSARVNGKPLFYWARNNLLHTITIPKKEVEIYNMEYLFETKISSAELLKIIIGRIGLVNGHFRQQEIISNWEKYFKNKEESYPIMKFKVSCSSGTYVRSIANELGKKVGVSSLAFSIKRTKVGEFTLKDAIQLCEKPEISMNMKI
ncbi:MAG: hypothetical protein ABIO02_04290 [Patescibacteria group bacterium]